MNSLDISLSNSGLLIRGPARIEVINGKAELFGAPLKKGSSTVLPGNRAYPIIALGEASIKVILGHGGGVVNYGVEELIPSEWRSFAENMDNGVYMVIGDVNTGKSGFILFCSNILVRRGVKVGVVDADIGQSDVGPPGTIGLALMETPSPTYQQLKLIDAYFIGDTTPVGHLLPMVVGTKKLVDLAIKRGADVILVNTTGMTYGGVGRALKWYKAEALRPKMIIGLQRSGENELLLSLLEALCPIKRLKTPPAVMAKKFEERKSFRESKFSLDMIGSKTFSLSLKRVKLLGVSMGQECPEIEQTLVKTGLEFCRALCDRFSLTVFLDGRPQRLPLLDGLRRVYREVRIVFSEQLKGLLVGLYDREMRFLGIGRIEEISFCKMMARVQSKVSSEEIEYVALGYIVLGPDGREVRRLRPGEI